MKKMRKKLILLFFIGLFFFDITGCSSKTKNGNEEQNTTEFTNITTSINADQNFNVKTYLNQNKDGIIIMLENGFKKNLRAISITIKQYNSKNKEINSTTNIAEYLLDGHMYINEYPINIKDHIEKIDVSVAIDELYTFNENEKLYNNQIKSFTKIDKQINMISFTITNNTDISITDLDLKLVYYKNEKPLFCIPIELSKIGPRGQHGGFDSIPPVVTMKDGITDLDFDKVKIIVNKARVK